MDVKTQSLNQDDFISILFPKLEALKKEREKHELLNKKLIEVNFAIAWLVGESKVLFNSGWASEK